MKRYLDLSLALSKLKAKTGVRVEGNYIYVLRSQTDCGNKTWGVIDYLVKVHHFYQGFVYKF
jgi:hypothetical protein